MSSPRGHLKTDLTPRHVAIVMDGNGRWAQQRRRDRFFGHVRGANRVKSIVEACLKAGVEALTLYAFSTENWQRPEQEKQILWALLRKYLQRYQEEMLKQNIRLGFMGQLERLPKEVQQQIQIAQEKLSKNTGLLLTFGLSYGSQDEILKATQRFAQECLAGHKTPKDLTCSLFEAYLELPLPVDLFIRTSGEKRLSNFLLWQSSYAELVFSPTLWPDFSPEHFHQALEDYAQRQRRFGGLTTP